MSADKGIYMGSRWLRIVLHIWYDPWCSQLPPCSHGVNGTEGKGPGPRGREGPRAESQGEDLGGRRQSNGHKYVKVCSGPFIGPHVPIQVFEAPFESEAAGSQGQTSA